MNKIDILKTLESKGALKYPKLRVLSGFGRRENGWLFTEYTLNLLRKSQISLNKSKKNLFNNRTWQVIHHTLRGARTQIARRLLVFSLTSRSLPMFLTVQNGTS